MKIETINNLLVFLEKTTLAGKEVPAFVEAIRELQELREQLGKKRVRKEKKNA